MTTERTTERTWFLNDVIVAAVEHGIGYWADVTDYRWAEDEFNNITYASAQVKPEEKEDWCELTLDVVERGIETILSGTVKTNPQLFKDIALGSVQNDAGKIDAEGADCIVQVALLGQIVYG